MEFYMRFKCPKWLAKMWLLIKYVWVCILDFFLKIVKGIVDILIHILKNIGPYFIGFLIFSIIPIACYVKNHEEELGIPKPEPQRVTVVNNKPEPEPVHKDEEYHTTVYVKWLDGNVQKLEVKNIRLFGIGTVYEITTETDDRLYFSVDNVVVLERKKKNGGTIKASTDYRTNGTR